MPITPEFRDILLAAKLLSKKTAGLCNPFILPALQKAGYDHSLVKRYKKDKMDDYSNRAVAPYDSLQIGKSWASIPYNTAIDLGGIGKGYLADQLAGLTADKVAGFWFSLGGDVVAGGTDKTNKPWKVMIEDANRTAKYIGYATAPKNDYIAVATSGMNARRGIKNNKQWHHVIDPRTLEPSKSDVISATVCSSSAMAADVLASCAVIAGSKSAMQFLRDRGIKDTLIQTAGQTQKIGRNIKLN